MLEAGRGPIRGSLRLPGDKSISHRAFLLNALGRGRGRVVGSNDGRDLQSTRQVLEGLGVVIRREGDAWLVHGRAGRLRAATDLLDCGNSGTTLRLAAGLAAAQPFTSTFTGDESLQRRPMERITAPLRRMGAQVDGPDGGRTAPLMITGGQLESRRFELEVASAQVKSGLLLAAAAAGVSVEIVEPHPSRDHTERMLQAMGAAIEFGAGWVRLERGGELSCVDVEVPGDPSAGALLAALVCAVPTSRLELREMSLNPGRTVFLDVLQRMGAKVERGNRRTSAGEERGDVMIVAPDALEPFTVEAAEVPSLIDEIPALATVAALARGTSRLHEVGELRFKESDRLEGIVHLLDEFGVEANVHGNDLVVEGRGGELRVPRRLRPPTDHRMVMAAAVLGTAALRRGGGASLVLESAGEAAVSFPAFFESLEMVSGGQ